MRDDLLAVAARDVEVDDGLTNPTPTQDWETDRRDRDQSRPPSRRAFIIPELALTPGVRLGPYEIVALLGAGGMGEVYKARDTRLDRTVTRPPRRRSDSSSKDAP